MSTKLNNRHGFTLIELMVVIVIIGVLASLAVPRFQEASTKAKVAEAPRVLISYEMAYLAALAERGTVTSVSDLAFDEDAVNAASKWFRYDIGPYNIIRVAHAIPKANIGKFGRITLAVEYSEFHGYFLRGTNMSVGNVAYNTAKKYVPNFFRD